MLEEIVGDRLLRKVVADGALQLIEDGVHDGRQLFAGHFASASRRIKSMLLIIDGYTIKYNGRWTYSSVTSLITVVSKYLEVMLSFEWLVTTLRQ